MNAIVQWATILSPIIAVFIAIISFRKNEKSVKEQIDAVLKLTKQVSDDTTQKLEAMRSLTSIQIDIARMQIERELKQTFISASQYENAQASSSNRDNFFHRQLVLNYPQIVEEEEKRKESENQYKADKENLSVLKAQKNRLDEMKQQIEGGK